MEAKERQSATRSQPPCASHLIVGRFAHFWSTATLQPPPKRTFPAPICEMISVVDTLSLSHSAKNADEEPILSSANYAQKVARLSDNAGIECWQSALFAVKFAVNSKFDTCKSSIKQLHSYIETHCYRSLVA